MTSLTHQTKKHDSLVLISLIDISIFIFIEEGVWQAHQETSSDKVSDKGYTPVTKNIWYVKVSN